MDLQTLNDEYAIPNEVIFIGGRGDMPVARISNDHATAEVSLYAGQVLSYRQTDDDNDLFFCSDTAYFEEGKSIKGGVPVCWPWFGPDPEGKGRPAHGFARNSQWQVVGSQSEEDGATRITLQLAPNEQSQSLWPHDFLLTLDVVVGKTLELRLTTTNRSKETLPITQALHTYFYVGDISQVSVAGLDGKTYIDKVDNGNEKIQQGVVTVQGEVDRIYTDVKTDLVIEDAALGRNIHIHASGSQSAVVWNPWSDIAKSMADLGDEDYKNLLCVETTNADPDIVEISPGNSWVISARYQIS